jgi:spore maturation protein CgeB
MFAWSSEAELNELYAQLLKSPERVAAVAEAGRRRVLSEHLYRHRIQTIMKAVA